MPLPMAVLYSMNHSYPQETAKGHFLYQHLKLVLIFERCIPFHSPNLQENIFLAYHEFSTIPFAEVP